MLLWDEIEHINSQCAVAFRGSKQMAKTGLWELEPCKTMNWQNKIATPNQLENDLKDNKNNIGFIE